MIYPIFVVSLLAIVCITIGAIKLSDYLWRMSQSNKALPGESESARLWRLAGGEPIDEVAAHLLDTAPSEPRRQPTPEERAHINKLLGLAPPKMTVHAPGTPERLAELQRSHALIQRREKTGPIDLDAYLRDVREARRLGIPHLPIKAYRT